MIVIGIASAVDTALSGHVRPLWVAVPSMVLLGGAMMAPTPRPWSDGCGFSASAIPERLGQCGGTVLVSVVASIATLAAGIVAVGSAGLVAAGALAIWLPKYSQFATSKAIRGNAAASRTSKTQPHAG